MMSKRLRGPATAQACGSRWIWRGPWNWWDVIGVGGNLPLESYPEAEGGLTIALNGWPLDGGDCSVLDIGRSTFMLWYRIDAPPLQVG